MRADGLIREGRWQEALEMLRVFDPIGEDEGYLASLQKAICWIEVGAYPQAEHEAALALSYGTDMADPYVYVARAQRLQGRSADAAATAQDGAQRFPHFPPLLRERGLALLDVGQVGEAYEDIMEAVEAFPDDYELLMAAGALAHGSDPDLAQEYFARATRIEPDSADAQFAYDSLAHPLRGAGRSSYAIEVDARVRAEYRAMLRRITGLLASVWKVLALLTLPVPIVGGLIVRMGDIPLLAWSVGSMGGVTVVTYAVVVRAISAFNAVLPPGVRLTFGVLARRFPDLKRSLGMYGRVLVLTALVSFAVLVIRS